MAIPPKNTADSSWTAAERSLFRTVFFFLLLLSIPVDWKFYAFIFQTDWSKLRFQDFFQLTSYMPDLFRISTGYSWGIVSYFQWGVFLVFSIGLSFLWKTLDKQIDYVKWYYWLRVIIRYRLAIAVIGYGILKVFSVQMPSPTYSDLHTSYGYLLPWKIYYLSTGVSFSYYEQALGLLEILGGLALLCRKTTIIGASLITFMLINVVLVNFAYEIGYHLYSSYLLLLALFLVSKDLPALYTLLVLQKKVVVSKVKYELQRKGLKTSRTVLRSVLFVFLAGYTLLTYSGVRSSNWPFSAIPGLKGKEGFYNVESFELNGLKHPYSLTDSLRWHNVVFEKWNTLSIETLEPVKIDLSVPEISYRESVQRNYEEQGNGGRHFYSYTFDPAKKEIHLTAKQHNESNGGKTSLYDHKKDHFILHYDFPSDSTITLSGKNSQGQQVAVTLARINKEYLLKRGRRKPIKIY